MRALSRLIVVASLLLAVPASAQSACTKELKICPDGTGVGRTGPNCEFAPCRTDGGAAYECSEADCGEPRMGMPNWECPDGSVGGPVCMPDDGGACGWRVRDCPYDSGFADVPTDHPNSDAIFYVRSHGVVHGYPDGTFKPDATINRAEFVKIVVESKRELMTYNVDGEWVSSADHCLITGLGGQWYMRGEEFPDGTISDSDIGRDDWFAKYFCVAFERHLLSGYPDGTFRPANTINFVEAAKILSLAYDIAVTGIAEGDPWYKPYVLSMQQKGAIPLSITRFDQSITRGEIAEMIYRLRLGGDKPSRTYEELEG